MNGLGMYGGSGMCAIPMDSAMNANVCAMPMGSSMGANVCAMPMGSSMGANVCAMPMGSSMGANVCAMPIPSNLNSGVCAIPVPLGGGMCQPPIMGGCKPPMMGGCAGGGNFPMMGGCAGSGNLPMMGGCAGGGNFPMMGGCAGGSSCPMMCGGFNPGMISGGMSSGGMMAKCFPCYPEDIFGYDPYDDMYPSYNSYGNGFGGCGSMLGGCGSMLGGCGSMLGGCGCGPMLGGGMYPQQCGGFGMYNNGFPQACGTSCIGNMYGGSQLQPKMIPQSSSNFPLTNSAEYPSQLGPFQSGYQFGPITQVNSTNVQPPSIGSTSMQQFPNKPSYMNYQSGGSTAQYVKPPIYKTLTGGSAGVTYPPSSIQQYSKPMYYNKAKKYKYGNTMTPQPFSFHVPGTLQPSFQTQSGQIYYCVPRISKVNQQYRGFNDKYSKSHASSNRHFIGPPKSTKNAMSLSSSSV